MSTVYRGYDIVDTHRPSGYAIRKGTELITSGFQTEEEAMKEIDRLKKAEIPRSPSRG